jgi:hypothetical protein
MVCIRLILFKRIILMPTVIGNLKDIIIAPGSTVDLASHPHGDVRERRHEAKGFLSSAMSVPIENCMTAIPEYEASGCFLTPPLTVGISGRQ